MFSVVFKCECIENTLCECEIYRKGEIEYFHIFVTADSFVMAYDRACDYLIDNYSDFDVSIISIQRVDEKED